MFSNISQYFGFGNSFYTGLATVSRAAQDLTESIGDISLDIFNSARKAVKYLVKDSVLDISLNQYQIDRAKETLDNAKTRNGAKTDQDIGKYHDSIRYSKENERGIFKSHKASGSKPKKLVILLMGNLQDPGMSEEKAGMLKIYNQVKAEDKHDLLLCRVGSAYEDLKHKLYMSDDPSLNTNVVYEHISNLIEDRCHLKGSFSDHQRPREIDIVGFSWGAGVQKKLESRWQRLTGRDEARTACIDAIQYGCNNFGDAICKKPKYSSQHLNIFQNNEYSLNGEKNCDKKDCDQFINVDDIDPSEPDHSEIDDSKAVHQKLLKFIDSSR
jgi:hypothetical protein